MMKTGVAGTLLSTVLLGFTISAAGPARAGDLYKPFKLLAQPFEAKHREKPVTCVDPCIEQLADQIDWLEHYIDTYGSIVAKHPDVWGESRLMRHRYEYERQMASQLDKFKVLMNAALRRSDQSFLGMAFALQAAAGNQLNSPDQLLGPPSISEAETNLNIVQGLISSPTETATESQGAVMSRNPLYSTEKGLGGFTFASDNLALEPTIQLDQMSRYLNHLNELRRINEGDDIADSPGYALNLVRIPVSVLPGKQTRKGYGAEITITAEPYLSDELLPTTFRNLVINDVVDQLAYPMTRVVNTGDEAILQYLRIIRKQHFVAATDGRSSPVEARMHYDGSSHGAAEPASEATRAVDVDTDVRLIQDIGELEAAFGAPNIPLPRTANNPDDARATAPWEPAVEGSERYSPDEDARLSMLENRIASALQMRGIQAFDVPVSQTRRARRPLSPTRLLEVHDVYLLGHVAADLYFGLKNHPVSRDQLHLMDVQAFLREETQGAYDLLQAEANEHLWLCAGHSLAVAVRRGDQEQLRTLRETFLKGIPVPPSASGRFTKGDTTIALAWAILVEASLLNDRLVQDMKEATVSKGCAACLADVQCLDFYNPMPSPQARAAFNEYVRCRWPIQVFALDPVTQDQNVADAYARRRELQVAAAVAFASGQMRAQALMRFTRRLEADMATVALNRTAVGFTHGNDTFGWRFRPRFQTPPTPGTFQAFGETLLGGPTRDADMRQRELEEGIRECTAIIVMPSFVPYATFDVRTNWYKLTNPKCTEISMRETMVLSRAITAMKNSAAACSRCAHLYREGEVERLLRRVDQLDRELPLQTMRVQIPYENTSGGFEIFNRGITELAPELIGWYGAPGINPAAATTMFLVGDGFSVHDTQVIAGGRTVPFELISRQLMKVEIPTGVQVLTRGTSKPGGEFNPRELEEVVDVHLATPYGVSSHLLVPVASAGAAVPAIGSFEMRPGANLDLYYTSKTTGIEIDDFFTLNQTALVVRAPRIAEVSNKVSITFFVRDAIEKTYIGSFDVTEIPLNQCDYEYYITGNKLKTLVTGTNMLKNVIIPYLTHEQAQGSVEFEVTAALTSSGIPIAGHFNAVCKPNPNAKPE